MKKFSDRLVGANKTEILKGITRGEKAIRECRVFSHTEAKKALSKWLTQKG